MSFGGSGGVVLSGGGEMEDAVSDGGVIGVDVGGGGGKERILVSVRLRPLNEKEIARNDLCDWECINDTSIIFRNSLRERSGFPIAYTFGEHIGVLLLFNVVCLYNVFL